jgi:hypothetical protein
MTPQEKANELTEKFKDYVHGYVGSSMLTNTEYPEQIIKQAKRCATIAVDEILKLECLLGGSKYPNDLYLKTTNHLEFWNEVKTEIEKL